MRRLAFFYLALVVSVVAIFSCTPLPDIEDDSSIIPNPLGDIDAAVCDSEAAPSVCDQLRR